MKYARPMLLLLPLLLTGCPGDWDEPLGPVRGGHIDSKLVGDWQCKGPDKAAGRVSIVAFDKNQYVIAMTPPDAKEKVGFYRAYTTTVSGYDVMNVKELDADPGDGAWIYARFFQPQDGHLAIQLLKTEPLDGTPDDVESRRQAIGDLYLEAALWEGLLSCEPFDDARTGNDARTDNDAPAKTATTQIGLGR